MPRGPRARIALSPEHVSLSQKADLAYDKAPVRADIASSQATTGISAKRSHCRRKVAGTRACYTCCQAHSLWASRCFDIAGPAVV
jgi:hypothetical protein